jgi:AcrR family transcriptional regulator
VFAIERRTGFVREKHGGEMEKGMDRRAARTRRALHEALIALILRKGYEAITIQDILDEANVGRSTFYAHYGGKEELLRGGFDKLRADLTTARKDALTGSGGRQARALTFSSAMFEHACGYKHVYRALVGGRGGIVAVNEIRRVLSDLVKAELPAIQEGKIPRELAVNFVVGAFLTVLTWLLERKPQLSAQQADMMFRRLVINGIGSSLKIPDTTA